MRLRKDGTRLDISLTVSPIKTGDRINGASAIARDVTERKRAADELERQKAAAEAANQAKDIFLAMLSHELRAPLSPVVSAIDDLESTLAASADGRAALAMIRRNIEHEARLIDDLLDLTRIVKGKLVLRREPLDAHRCIQDAAELCRSEIAHQRIELQTDLRAVQHFVNADATKLQQIIWNLVRNAVKFSPEGGVVSITSNNDAAGLLAIHVRDYGIGIDPDMLRRIFTPFEQGEGLVRRRYGGLGLGLAISKALAEAHGGVLVAASGGRNLGATFTLTLNTVPAEALPAKPDVAAPLPRKAPADLRILLVDDHADTRIALERLLRRRGYQVESAHDVHSALELAARLPFDLLVSDIGLPDESGFELIRKLQLAHPIKGIAVSGFGMEGDLQKSRAAGFSEHLLKPVNFQELEAAIWSTVSLS
ncbi:MAG TPA: ATP-binding protein [Chthoniobacteraceae bacterium]|nr:ATP-binding protein [Chthoniobacteraceae bacterium]